EQVRLSSAHAPMQDDPPVLALRIVVVEVLLDGLVDHHLVLARGDEGSARALRIARGDGGAIEGAQPLGEVLADAAPAGRLSIGTRRDEACVLAQRAAAHAGAGTGDRTLPRAGDDVAISTTIPASRLCTGMADLERASTRHPFGLT